MSIQSEIDRISGAVQNAFTALTDKGVTVPDGTNVTGLADLIAAIEAGGGGKISVAYGTFTPSYGSNTAPASLAGEECPTDNVIFIFMRKGTHNTYSSYIYAEIKNGVSSGFTVKGTSCTYSEAVTVTVDSHIRFGGDAYLAGGGPNPPTYQYVIIGGL